MGVATFLIEILATRHGFKSAWTRHTVEKRNQPSHKLTTRKHKTDLTHYLCLKAWLLSSDWSFRQVMNLSYTTPTVRIGESEVTIWVWWELTPRKLVYLHTGPFEAAFDFF
jgi:hypothetical protein